MRFTPILASDVSGGAVLLLFLVPVCLAAFGAATAALNVKVASGRWWGMVMGLIPTFGGGLALLVFLMTAGGVPMFFYPGAVASFASGIVSLYFWARGWARARPDASQNIPIALQVILYIGLAAAFIFLLVALL
jgi:hypothetical protein